jgi:hypothetical protein
MRTTIDMVQEFHDVYRADDIPELGKLRLKLLKEELQELENAILADNKVEILDALTDLQYVLDGTYIAFRLKEVKQLAFEEVHASNMSKIGVDGKPIYREDGKILKGPNYFKPNLTQFIHK